MVASLFPVTARGLTVHRRGKKLLGPVDMTLGATGLTVIIGPNGAGKTTLLKALAGMERLSSGTLSYATDAADAQARQAYVFQTPVMLRRCVGDNLAYPLQLVATPKPQIKQAVQDWAARIGLQDALSQSAQQLSGGEKQKLSIARALIRTPDLLFLDEPCTNLDGHATRDIETLLQQARRAGTRIVMATHDLGQARRLADDAVFLLGGCVHEHGGPSLFDAPQTEALKAFLRGDIVA